jgi:hypothetical protein
MTQQVMSPLAFKQWQSALANWPQERLRLQPHHV